MKKLGIALSAGGSRGVSHIGFLKALEEEGIRPDFIAGTSMGAVVGACYASGLSTEYMTSVIKKLKFSDIFDLSLNPIKNAALLRSQKMGKQIKKHLGEITFSQLKIPFACVATDVVSGKSVVLNADGEQVYQSVVASASIPSIFKPVARGAELLVDGGVLCRIPIDTVRNMGAQVVVAVDALGDVRVNEKKPNVFNIMGRIFDIADSELTRLKAEKQKPDLFIVPKLGDMNQYKFKEIDSAIECGYQAGKEYVKQIKNLIESK